MNSSPLVYYTYLSLAMLAMHRISAGLLCHLIICFLFQGAHYVVKLQDDNVLRLVRAEECYATRARWKRLNPAARLNWSFYWTARLLHCVFSLCCTVYYVQDCLFEILKNNNNNINLSSLLCMPFREKLYVPLTSGDNNKVSYC